jgi:ADP-ribose pyrophosphatase YjhB (NUDIX family)
MENSMSLPPEHFKHCPRCGKPEPGIADKKLTCAACGFVYFFNPTIGTAGFIENEKGEVLLITRGKDPAKGKLAPPGGFADYGESAEEALTREVREETGLNVSNWRYLTSAVNWYTYADITYPVTDFFYAARVSGEQALDLCTSETDGAHWHLKADIDSDSLAFPSMQEAFRVYVHELDHQVNPEQS